MIENFHFERTLKFKIIKILAKTKFIEKLNYFYIVEFEFEYNQHLNLTLIFVIVKESYSDTKFESKIDPYLCGNYVKNSPSKSPRGKKFTL